MHPMGSRLELTVLGEFADPRGEYTLNIKRSTNNYDLKRLRSMPRRKTGDGTVTVDAVINSGIQFDPLTTWGFGPLEIIASSGTERGLISC